MNSKAPHCPSLRISRFGQPESRLQHRVTAAAGNQGQGSATSWDSLLRLICLGALFLGWMSPASVMALPQVTSYPIDKDVLVGDTVSLTAAATGTGTVTYQWRKRRWDRDFNSTTLAGAAGSAGSSDGALAQALFNNPIGAIVAPNGDVYVSDYGNNTIRKITAAGVVSTFAGQTGVAGSLNGTKTGAQFYGPGGLAFDTAGNLFVADNKNHTIRKITPAGLVSTFAGQPGEMGNADGAATVARFQYPCSLAIDSTGNLYVADSENNAVRKITPSGNVKTLASGFDNPRGVAIDSKGNLYLADFGNHVVRKITASGVVTTLAGALGQAGRKDGTGTDALFNYPNCVAVDGRGNVYVTDLGNNCVRQINPKGEVFQITGYDGSMGSEDGNSAAIRLNTPFGICSDGAGNLYVGDKGNHTIRLVRPGVLIAGQTQSNYSFSATGAGETYQYDCVIADSTGNIATSQNKVNVALVRVAQQPSGGKVSLGGSMTLKVRATAPSTVTYQWRKSALVTTLAGMPETSGSANGVGALAQFNEPQGVAADAAGTVYVADTANHTIRKVSAAGEVTTLAGIAGTAGSDDGAVASATFNQPQGVAVDSAGNVYVADTKNHVIRLITSDGQVSTYAGMKGNAGWMDDIGTSAQFNGPTGVAVDGNGNVYVADYDNRVIRKIAADRTVTTLDGSFNSPYGVAADKAGNVYVADRWDATIKKIKADGTVAVLAGSSGTTDGIDGFGAAARFSEPRGVAVDGAGNVYVGTYWGRTIRVITPAGDVTSIAGRFTDDGVSDGAGQNARFLRPVAVAVDPNGVVYVGDPELQTIRKIIPGAVLTGEKGATYTIASATLANGGFYECVVSSGGGNETSAPALVVLETVRISTQPTPTTVTKGTPAQLSVVASGSGALSYQWIKSSVVSTLTGTAGTSGAKNGAAASALFNGPTGVALAGNGDVYVTDTLNHVIRKITVAGEVSTYAGLEGVPGIVNGAASGARFNKPLGLAFDSVGNLYVADNDNEVIRKITSGGVVSTFAGTAGVKGSADGPGTSAAFDGPVGLSVDKSGNLFVTDGDNSTIRKITPSGVVSTFAGTAGNFGESDGLGTLASFRYPAGIAVDGDGNVYVGDSDNGTVRKISPGGNVTTLAGSAGGAVGVAVDASGSVYVTNLDGCTIRKITAAGVETTIAGDFGNAGSADGPGSIARFNEPRLITLDGAGNAYVADYRNHTIRKIKLPKDMAPGAVVNGATFTLPTAVTSDTGLYECVISDATGSITSASVLLQVTETAKTPQFITFGVLPDKLTTNGPITLSASASPSSLPVTFELVSGPATLSGTTLTLSGGTGLVTVTASQAGNATYAAATPVTRSFNVSTAPLKPQMITFGALSDKLTTSGPITLTGSASPSSLPVTFELVSGPATLSGTTLTLSGGTGLVTVTASQAGNATYAAATPVTRSFNVSTAPLKPQMITFGALSDKLTTSGPITLTGSASPSSLPVTFELVSGPATLSGTTLTLNGGTGLVTVTASQAGNATYAAAPPVTRSFNVSVSPPVAQKISFTPPVGLVYGGSAAQLSATSSSGLPVTFGIVSGPAILTDSSLTPTGAGNVVVSLSQAGNIGFLPISNKVTLVVGKKPLIVRAENATRVVGAPNPTFTLTYDGFVGSDTETVLDKKPTASANTTVSSVAGNYPITVSGGLDNNYTFVAGAPAGTLTIVGFGGSYEALLLDEGSLPIGKLELTVPSSSLNYSGRLLLAGDAKVITLKGSLVPSKDLSSVTGAVVANSSGASFDLAFEITDQGELSGDAMSSRASDLTRNGESFANLANGARLNVFAKGVTAPWAGTHTMLLLARGNTEASPQGAGYASAVVVATSGAMTLTGKLADGTVLTAALKPAADGSYILWSNPYNTRLNSYVAGRLVLQPHPDTERFPGRYYIPITEGVLTWAKAASTSKPLDVSYRDGFGPLSVSVAFDPWLPVTKTATLPQRLGLEETSLDAGAFNITYGQDDLEALDFGAMSSSLASSGSLSVKGVVAVTAPGTVPVNATKWRVTVTPASGVFEGSFVLSDIVPPSTKATVRTVTFAGILRQAPSDDVSGLIGGGFVLLPALTNPTTTEKPSGKILFSVPN
ncbi:MAG: MBG domain-containing protein [Verrucomicrobiota bacterium]